MVISDPRIRGRWARIGDQTIVQICLYSKWYEWVGTILGWSLLGFVVAALITSFFQSLPVSTFCLTASGCAAVFMGLFLKRRRVRIASQAEAFGKSAAVVLDGRIVEEPLGLQFEMERMSAL
ncbi:MAG: hypothetical protein ACYS8X_14320 [Planctomycetota bacterium]